MTVDQNTLEALRLDSLDVPPGLKVDDVRVEEYVNAEGEDALRVTVVLADDADFGPSAGEDVHRLKMSIHDNLLNHGVTLFPYIFISTPSGEADAARSENEGE